MRIDALPLSPAARRRLQEWMLLTRFDRPIGWLLLLWPILWALWIAVRGLPSLKLLVVFGGGMSRFDTGEPTPWRERLAGVVLDDDPKPVRAADCVQTGELTLSLVLTEGKYHQVKRMLAAVGNRVEGLHRSRIGGLALPADLAPGQWRMFSCHLWTR